MLIGNIPQNEPNLDGKGPKRQWFTISDCGNAVSNFVVTSNDLFGTFSTYVRNEARAEAFCLSC